MIEVNERAIHRTGVWQSIEKDCTVIAVEGRVDSAWQPMALVRHDEPHGSFHYDWFLAGATSARTFRCAHRLDQLAGAAETPLVAIDDHRLFYVHLSERFELSGGRGIVTPIARGWWRPSGTPCEAICELIEVRWSPTDVARTFRLTCDARGITLSPHSES